MSKSLRLLVSAALLGWLAWQAPWGRIGQAFGNLRLGWWLAALGLYLAAQVASALRWQLLARPLGFRQPLRHFVGFYLIGMYFNLVLPTSVGGDVVRAWYLDGRSGRRLAAFLSVLVDRATGLLVLLALACVAMTFCPVAVPFWVPASVWGTAAAAGVGLAALPAVTRMGRRFERVARLVEQGRFYLGRPGLLLGSTALSVIVQAANVLLVCLVGRAVGVAVPDAYYWVLVPMVSLLTLLPVSLNGMGIREWGMVLFLKPVGVDQGTALTLAFLWFLVFTAASLAGGAVYLFGSFPRPEVRSDHEAVGDHPDQGREGQSRAA